MAVSAEKGVEHFKVVPKSVSNSEFKEFLGELSALNNGNSLALFMDNMSVHSSKASRAAYENLSIRAVFNVPYSP